MDQSVVKMDDGNILLGEWRLNETDLLEYKRQALRKEKREIERARRKLEHERQQFHREKEEEIRRIESEKQLFERERQKFHIEKKASDRAMESERQLFEMKWKILEEELQKLAKDKMQVERQRKFYEYVSEHEAKTESAPQEIVRGEMFFVGVEDKQALKKRYKDLLKIYHPDNLTGDVKTIQEINREYDRLKAQYS